MEPMYQSLVHMHATHGCIFFVPVCICVCAQVHVYIDAQVTVDSPQLFSISVFETGPLSGTDELHLTG